MPLTPGTRLGPYEILSAIGAGGMGEVYKARDTRLDRIVAIKVLPADVASDPQFRERFDREARAVAALNHPHICTLFDIGEAPDPDSPATSLQPPATIQFIVMEYLDGETLAKRLEKGALSLDQALRYAIELADALDKAHRAGITHRDVKPGNVMVTKSGTKLLDFGLAKKGGPAVAGVNLSMLPTTPAALTAQGTILGTFQYMAPEQIEGEEADARTDLFAFGVVLYEMLTGRKAFTGKTQASLFGAILNQEPPPISTLLDSTAGQRLRPERGAGGKRGAATPPSESERGWGPASIQVIDRVVKKCLAKERDDRWQTARDLHDELQWLLEGAFETVAPQTMVTTVAPAPRGRLAWMIAAAAVLVAIVLAFPAVRYLRETPPPETRTDLVTPTTGDPTSFALSPDGHQIVFVASGDGASRLWLRSLATTTALPLAGTEGASAPFWSPDSRSVGFFATGQLKRIDLGGGAPHTVATPAVARGGTWNADGVILFAPTFGSPLFRVAASGGQAVAVTTLDRQASHRWPVFLPDGRHFLFLSVGSPDTAGIHLGALDAGATTRLTSAGSRGVYLPGQGGWLLWVRAGTLVAQRLDRTLQALTGDPVTLADPVAVDGNNASAVSVSATGLVAYRTGAASRRQLAWVDRSGKALGTLGAPDDTALNNPSISPDGRRVAVSRMVQGNTDLWLLDGTRTSRFTFDAARDQFPVWSPDGRQIVFGSDRKGPRDLYQKSSSGAGAEAPLVESSQLKTPTDWSADGQFLLYNSQDPQTGNDLWVQPLTGDGKPWVFLKTNFDERQGQFSPDGRWVAYMSNESGRPEVYIRPFVPPSRDASADKPGGQWQVSTAGGLYPRWRHDGQELYYIGPNGDMMAAPITATGTTLQPGAPVALFPTRIVGGGADNGQGRQYDVTRDGRFLINTELDSAAAPITLLQNWTPEAKK